MQYILNQRYDETASINFIGYETIGNAAPNQKVLSLKTDTISSVIKFTSFSDSVTLNDTNIQRKFKYKQCENWSDLQDIGELCNISINPNCNFELELLYYFTDNGNLSAPPATISNVKIDFTYNIEKTNGLVTLTEPNKAIILEPADTYKIFELTGFEMLSRGIVDANDIDIKYRFTQDGGYTFTKWEPLTTENISTSRKHLNELRFAKVQYMIQKTENSTSNIVVYDIMLLGDFQNVSANYLKTNRYGLKEDCVTNYINSNPTLSNNFDTNGLSCYATSSNKETLANLSNWNAANDGLWNPYKQAPEITNFYNYLANQTNSIFGWDVDYYKTDPDGNGIDYQIHEYGLYNVIKKESIKVIVPENKFPDNSIQLNQYNLVLFDSFEVHILKDVFKAKFGAEERPGKKDILYFCITNRLYYVKHAQVYKEIMNMGIYYKVILEKYETKANINFKEASLKESLEPYTDNTTIDELFGFENRQDEQKISNKDQMYTKSMDKIRQSISSKVSIVNEPVYNGEVDFIKYYYNFNKVVKQRAVEYKNVDNDLKISDNRSFISWFKINSTFDENKGITNRVFGGYTIDLSTEYCLLDNYDIASKSGYKYYYKNGKVELLINDQAHALAAPNLLSNVWYGVFINLDQRQRTVDIRLYKRMTSVTVTLYHPSSYERIDIASTDIDGLRNAANNGFKPVCNTEVGSTAVSTFELVAKAVKNIEAQSYTHDISVALIGADMCYSNLRIFNDIIEEEHINNVLNQNIVVDAGKLIIADNANRKIYTNNVQSKNFR